MRKDISPHLMQEGDYGKWNGDWYAVPPGWKFGPANLSNHSVYEHIDGTITVLPSILVDAGDGEGGSVASWHGYLSQGAWKPL